MATHIPLHSKKECERSHLEQLKRCDGQRRYFHFQKQEHYSRRVRPVPSAFSFSTLKSFCFEIWSGERMVWWVNQYVWTAVLPRLCPWYLPRQYALARVRNFFCTHSQHKICQIGQTVVRDPLCHVAQTDDGISIPGVTEPSTGHRQCQLYSAAGSQ